MKCRYERVNNALVKLGRMIIPENETDIKEIMALINEMDASMHYMDKAISSVQSMLLSSATTLDNVQKDVETCGCK